MQHSLDASQRAYLAITILLFIILVLLLCRRTFAHRRKRFWKTSRGTHAQIPLFNEKKPIPQRPAGSFLSAGFWVGFFGTPAWESRRYHRNAEAGPRFHHLLTTKDAATIQRARIRIPPPLPAYIPPSRSIPDIAFEIPTLAESPPRNHDTLQLGLYPASAKLQGAESSFSNPAPRAQPQCTHLHPNGCLCFRLPDITIHTVDSSTPSISVTPVVDSSLFLDCHESSTLAPKSSFPEEDPPRRKHAVDSLEASHKSPPSFKSPSS